jgi:hypothetical protein
MQCRLDLVLKAFRSQRSTMVIDIPHILPSNGLHELGNRQRLARCHQQMYRVSYQHIGMYLAAVPLSRLAQAIEVAVIILLGEERGNSWLLPRWMAC